MRFDAAATLKFALQIQPDTRQVVVVSGASPYDRTLETLTRQELADYKDRLNLTYLSALPVTEILHAVAALPAKTIILYLTVFEDGAGKQFFPRDVAAAITKASSVPVYGIYDTYLPAGIVGGHMDTFEEIGTATGKLALRLLAGELPGIREEKLPEIGADHASWPALQRWNIAEQRLPPGTIEHFKQPTLWSEYRWQIITVVALVEVQTLLLLALLIQARRRRRAEFLSQGERDPHGLGYRVGQSRLVVLGPACPSMVHPHLSRDYGPEGSRGSDVRAFPGPGSSR